MTTQIGEKISDFESSVLEAFQFLIDEYGFVKQTIKKIDFEYPKDRMVEVDFVGKEVSVAIQWYLTDADIGVGIVENIRGKIPEKYSFYGDKDVARAVSLSDLVEYVTKSRNLIVLPETKLDESVRKTVKAWELRDKIISKNMNSVVFSFASLLHIYAAGILAGDLSVFPEVQAFSKKKLGA